MSPANTNTDTPNVFYVFDNGRQFEARISRVGHAMLSVRVNAGDVIAVDADGAVALEADAAVIEANQTALEANQTALEANQTALEASLTPYAAALEASLTPYAIPETISETTGLAAQPALLDFVGITTTTTTMPFQTTTTYTFDPQGNRISSTLEVCDNHIALGAAGHTTTYTHDANNRLLTSTKITTGGNAAIADGSAAIADGDVTITTFTYDANGNQLTQTTATPDDDGGQVVNTQTNTYNAFNQLTQVIITSTDENSTDDDTNTNTTTAIYTYRTDGLRHSKDINGNVTIHIWDRNHIILELDESGAVVERYQRGRNGHLISSDNHGFYLFNARGDVIQRVNSGTNNSDDGDNNNIQILHVYMYDAFGNELRPDEENTNWFRFAGEYFDIETGTYYLRARHFNPRTGRFTQPDPHWNIHNMQSDAASIIQSGNLYMFVMHNPVMFVDSSGLVAVPAWVIEMWDANVDFTRGYWTGIGEYFIGIGEVLTNPIIIIDGIVYMVENPADIPAIMSARKMEGFEALIIGDFYNFGRSIGQGMAEAGVTAATAGLGAGLGGKKVAGTRATARAGAAASASNPWGNTANLVSSATRPGTAGVTPVGRAFQKHSTRPGTWVTGTSTGNAAQNTQQGLNHLNSVLNNPNATFTVTNHPVHGKVLNVRLPDGAGVQWTFDGTRFITFLEKYTNR